MKTIIFRTECNGRSKYFTDITLAFRHFYKCFIDGKSVEIWIVGNVENDDKTLIKTQELLDSVYFH